MLELFKRRGKASFVLGGQSGSEGKGSAVAYLATHLAERGEMFDVVTANNGVQSGHTSIHQNKKNILFHLPTASVFPLHDLCPFTYLNGGAIINPGILLRELDENPGVRRKFSIHPNAAIVTPECIEAEMREDSAQTRISSTRKGVGEALSRKILRSGMVAKDCEQLRPFIGWVDLPDMMMRGSSVLVEIPQGHTLSIDGPFYPYTTSRNCTVMQAMSDAGIHPHFYHQSMMVIRTFPIKVGSLSEMNHSGDCFPDQHEITWAELGVQAELTTVTKRTRRVYTFSEDQVLEAVAQTRPAVVFITFMDYLPNRELAKIVVDKVRRICHTVGSVRHDGPEILTQWGPTTADVIRAEDL